MCSTVSTGERRHAHGRETAPDSAWPSPRQLSRHTEGASGWTMSSHMGRDLSLRSLVRRERLSATTRPLKDPRERTLELCHAGRLRGGDAFDARGEATDNAELGQGPTVVDAVLIDGSAACLSIEESCPTRRGEVDGTGLRRGDNTGGRDERRLTVRCDLIGAERVAAGIRDVVEATDAEYPAERHLAVTLRFGIGQRAVGFDDVR